MSTLSENPASINPALKGKGTQPIAGGDKKSDPLQRLLMESSGDELALQLRNPVRLSPIYLNSIIANGVTMLSTMSSELGVVLRIHIRGESIPVMADFENVRRSINALIIHLLTVSKPQGCVTVASQAQTQEGKRGISVQFTSNPVIVPWKPDWEEEEGFGNQQEISLCRSLLERNGGRMTVRWGEDETLSYTVWIPLKGPRGG